MRPPSKQQMLSKPALCLFVLALCTIANTVSAATEDDYGIIIDAGSTGSRAYLYSWPRRVIEGTQPGPPTTLVVSQPVMSTKGGALSEAKPEAIGELLTPLLAECKAFLVGKNIDISKIPVYLGATAGMRLLPADTRESIMIATRKYFAHSGFYFKDIFSKILSGEEEGLFGWIAANYLLGHFKPESSLLETFGALDLGGASTQITVDPRVTIMEDYFDFHGPYRKRYNLYTHSFLNFGREAMSDRINTVVSGDSAVEATFDHPCYNTNVVKLWTHRGVTITFKGTSNYAACRDIVLGLLPKNTCAYTLDRCSFNGVYQPPLTGSEFVAFSAYARMLVTAGMALDGGKSVKPMTIKELAVDETCKLTIEELHALHPKSDLIYLQEACNSLVYIYALLVDGYGFEEHTHQLHFIPSIDGVEMSWALGRIIYEANLLPYEHMPGKAESTSMIPAIVVIVILAVIVIVLSVLLYRARERKNELLLQGTSGLSVPLDSNLGPLLKDQP